MRDNDIIDITEMKGFDMEKYRIDKSKGLEFGIYSLGDHNPNPKTGEFIPSQQRIEEIIKIAKYAEDAGLDFFGLGESHQEFFTSQAHTVILGAIAQATNRMKIGSSSSIISTSDPVRVYEDFATIDLISNGRAEIVAGRASRVGLFELLGYDLADYEALFEEKFELLNIINEHEVVNWEGEFRKPLKDAQVIPRPKNGSLPIWRAVGGTPTSAIKTGYAGVPMTLAHLGGAVSSFKRSVDAYREAASLAGHDVDSLPVATAGFFYVAENSQDAIREYYPHIYQATKLSNGQGFPKQFMAQAPSTHSVLNVGSPAQIVDKLLHQHEEFGNQRYVAQLDMGGIPYDQIMKNIDLIGSQILPEIRKHTQK